MTWQFWVVIVSFGGILIIFHSLRLLTMCRVYKRTLRRTHQWIKVLQICEPIANCISSLISAFALKEPEMMRVVIT